MRFWNACVTTRGCRRKSRRIFAPASGPAPEIQAGAGPGAGAVESLVELRPDGTRARLARGSCWLACTLVLALIPAVARAEGASAGPASAAELLSAYARMPGLEARFVEEKQLSLLEKPITSSGRLYFARPGYLLRQVETPASAKVLITPERVTLRDGSGEQVLDLRTRPDVRPFVESLVWLLAGDQARLSKVYSLAFDKAGDTGAWQLVLTPKQGPLAKLVAQICIQGKGLSVSEIKVREKGGDQTVTRIVEANAQRTFSKAERQKLFGVKGP